MLSGSVKNLAIAIQRGNAFSILSAGWERFQRVGGVQLHVTPHFVPEGISSSMRYFIVLLILNLFIFTFFSSRNKVPQKKFPIILHACLHYTVYTSLQLFS